MSFKKFSSDQEAPNKDTAAKAPASDQPNNEADAASAANTPEVIPVSTS